MVKPVLGFRQFLLHGLNKVRGEWRLVTMAWNVKRMFVLVEKLREMGRYCLYPRLAGRPELDLNGKWRVMRRPEAPEPRRAASNAIFAHYGKLVSYVTPTGCSSPEHWDASTRPSRPQV